MTDRPNILFILLDATRFDYCSTYGYPRQSTPNLDRLAAQGVQFNQAIAPAPWTLPSIASMFTGHYPSETQIYPNLSLDETYPTLAEILTHNGYATYLSTMNSWLSEPFGLQRGFSAVNKQWQLIQTKKDINKLVAMQEEANGNLYQTVLRQLTQGNPVTNALNLAYYKLFAYRKDTGARRVLSPFQRWLHKGKRTNRPWFAFIHYLEAHLEYKPPREWVERTVDDVDLRTSMLDLLANDQWRMAWRHMAKVEAMPGENLAAWKRLYEIEVAYTDFYMGKLLDWLEDTGEMENTLVIVVADHGENLGEHDLFNHQYCVFDTLIQVPYVMYWKDKLNPHVVNQQVQTQDIFGTILEAAQVKNPVDDQRSHLQSDYGIREIAVTEYGQPRLPHKHLLDKYGFSISDLTGYDRGFTSLRTSDHKAITGSDGSLQIYDLIDDPAEVCNLASSVTPDAQILAEALKNWVTKHPISSIGIREETADEDVDQRLRDLGYL